MREIANVEEIKILYPDQYSSIISAMAKKGVRESEITWNYSWGIMMGNFDCSSLAIPKSPETLKEITEDVKKRYTVCIEGICGRKRNSELIDIKEYTPDFIKEIINSRFNKIEAEKNYKTTKAENLDSILKAVGKSGTSNPKEKKGTGVFGFFSYYTKDPVYPTLEDIKIARPDIYQKYIDEADGTNLIIYNPRANDCDVWGFNKMFVELATRRDDNVRLITPVQGLSSLNYLLNGDSVIWNGTLSKIEKAKAAAEGTNFKGWKNTNQYRFTREEIKDMIGGKIFLFKF